MRSSPARPRSRIRSSLVRRLKFWNSARSRWRASRYSSAVGARRVALGGQRLDLGEQSAVGEMSISSAALLARACGADAQAYR